MVLVSHGGAHVFLHGGGEIIAGAVAEMEDQGDLISGFEEVLGLRGNKHHVVAAGF